jgi:hypothetical protein
MLLFYLFVVIVLPAAVGLYVALQGMPCSRRCPTCAEETLLIRSGVHRLASAALRATELQRRWCVRCGWQGTVRLDRAPAPAGHPAVRRVGGRRAPSDQVDIRRLEIDGHRWKVMVQCWSEGDRWVGRLLFVGPNGQSCLDESSSLEGDSALEVLSSALSIPEQALAGRIRRAIH